jgi:DNA ligase 4
MATTAVLPTRHNVSTSCELRWTRPRFVAPNNCPFDPIESTRQTPFSQGSITLKGETTRTATAFKFKLLVQLLNRLDAARIKAQNASTPHPLDTGTASAIVKGWFAEHEAAIPRHGSSAVAFLSSLLLDKLPHRVYGIQAKTLTTIICPVLGLTEQRGRGQQLAAKAKEGILDFAECVQDVMREAENAVPLEQHEVTLDEIDEAFVQLAAKFRFATSATSRHAVHEKSSKIIAPIVKRLQSNEAKWFVRMLLKSYTPIELPDGLIMGCFHFLLPQILPYQNSLEAAIKMLGEPAFVSIPHNPPFSERDQYRHACAGHLTAELNVMIKRQDFRKARSLHECCNAAQGRKMSVERKYDGFHCQLHVDMSRRTPSFKIFSKSGKDQTANWTGLHSPIKTALGLTSPDCKIKHSCILEGEMLVYNREQGTIQHFDKLRKYVEYNGRTIGAEADSPRSPHDQFMLAFYDCLWHEKTLLDEPLSVRRQHLEAVVRPHEGVAILGERDIIDFRAANAKTAKRELQEYLQHCIYQRWEGLVLKRLDDSYFSERGNGHTGAIKLKPDYLRGVGDQVDVCIVGGRLDQTEAERVGGSLRWTSFYVACLTNKEDVQQYGSKMDFMILDTIDHGSISAAMIKELNFRGIGSGLKPSECQKYSVRIDRPDLKRTPPTVLFDKPFVIELTGAGFGKPLNAAFYWLKFPRDLKLHDIDRSPLETQSFEELQQMALASFAAVDPTEQEDIDMARRLMAADPKKHQRPPSESQETSTPSTVSVATTTPIPGVLPRPSQIPQTPSRPNRARTAEVQPTQGSAAGSSASTASIGMGIFRRGQAAERGRESPLVSHHPGRMAVNENPAQRSPDPGDVFTVSVSTQSMKRWNERLAEREANQSTPSRAVSSAAAGRSLALQSPDPADVSTISVSTQSMRRWNEQFARRDGCSSTPSRVVTFAVGGVVARQPPDPADVSPVSASSSGSTHLNPAVVRPPRTPAAPIAGANRRASRPGSSPSLAIVLSDSEEEGSHRGKRKRDSPDMVPVVYERVKQAEVAQLSNVQAGHENDKMPPPSKKRRPLGELNNVSATRGLDKMETVAKNPTDAQSHENRVAASTHEPAKSPQHAAPAPFDFNTAIFQHLLTEPSSDYGNTNEADSVILMHVPPDGLDECEAKSSLLRREVSRAYRSYQATARVDPIGSIPTDHRPRSAAPQRRLVLFYKDESIPHFRAAALGNARRSNTRELLPQDRMKEFFVGGVFLGIHPESEEVFGQRLEQCQTAMQWVQEMGTDIFLEL